MTEHFALFDASQHLDSEEVIAEYLAAAAETGNPTFFITALGDVAKTRGMAQDVATTRGMAQIAKNAGLGREGLYKALNGQTQPRFETINAVMQALGVKFRRGRDPPAELTTSTPATRARPRSREAGAQIHGQASAGV